MHDLNYQHLYYFWTVAREGTISAASRTLHLTQPTISAQLKLLQDRLGFQLFRREGRRLRLTSQGRTAYEYADQIFSLGNELQQALREAGTAKPAQLRVGISDVLPKLIAYRLLDPALRSDDALRLVCSEGPANELLAQLSVHKVDLVLTDAPIGPDVHVKAYNHLLGRCGITVFGDRELATKHRKRFPESLDGAPFLLPTEGTALRSSLERWFDILNVRPNVTGEFADSALLKVFGQAGRGLLVGPSAIEAEIRKQYDLFVVGRTDQVTERFFAVSVERKVRHPAVLAIARSARQFLLEST